MASTTPSKSDVSSFQFTRQTELLVLLFLVGALSLVGNFRAILPERVSTSTLVSASTPSTTGRSWTDGDSIPEPDDASAIPIITNPFQGRRATAPYFSTILLQGQFNYEDIPVEHIVSWVETWSQYFKQIRVVGPFSMETQIELQSRDIDCRYGTKGPRDAGSPSCYANLLMTIQEYQKNRTSGDVPPLDGVLYLHDDLLLNLTEFFGSDINTFSQRKNSVVQTWAYNDRPADYSKETRHSYWIDIRSPTSQPPAQRSVGVTYRNHITNATFPNVKALFRTLPNSRWSHECSRGLVKVARDPRTRYYLQEDGSLYFPGSRLSDVLYVPQSQFTTFARAAEIHMDHEHFLECAMPSILHMMEIDSRLQGRSFHKEEISLCTQYGPYRGKPAMIHHCFTAGRVNRYYQGIYHPIKLSYGSNTYQTMLELVQKPRQRIQHFNWTPYLLASDN